MALIEYIPLFLPVFMFALIGALSLFWYTRTRRIGFAWIGIGFVVGIIPDLGLALEPSLVSGLLQQGLNAYEIRQFLFLLYLINTAVSVVFTVLVLVGLVSLAREAKK
jgi:Na+/proline symporter